MDWRFRQTCKDFLSPGGVVLLCAAVLQQTNTLPLSRSALQFFFYGLLAVTALLGWRFRSSITLLSVFTIFLAHRSVDFFSAGHSPFVGNGHIALMVVSVLVPTNLILITIKRSGREWKLNAFPPFLGLLLVESVYVAVICSPGANRTPLLLRTHVLPAAWFAWTRISQLGLLALALAMGILLTRFNRSRQRPEAGMFWAITAFAFSLHHGIITVVGECYLGTAVAVLLASLIENSYFLAYHDELTGLPSRRAFRETVSDLVAPYVVAAVDIDHFKKINDSYGHDVGDQVLRMVASHIADVGGGGRAFRVGGEEFSVLFKALNLSSALPYLQNLRSSVESFEFQLRSTGERRAINRGPDRRVPTRSTRRKSQPDSTVSVRVTISIGVAEATLENTSASELVLAADKALYSAKRSGRNRVTAAEPPSRPRRLRKKLA